MEGSSSRPEIPTLTPTATSLDFCHGFGKRLEITKKNHLPDEWLNLGSSAHS